MWTLQGVVEKYLPGDKLSRYGSHPEKLEIIHIKGAYRTEVYFGYVWIRLWMREWGVAIWSK